MLLWRYIRIVGRVRGNESGSFRAIFVPTTERLGTSL